MLYVTRSRYKESVTASGLAEANKLLDTEIFPVVEKVQGVRSVQAYNSINGEVVLLLDIENLATIDRVLADPGCQAAFGKIYTHLARSGGEVLYDRQRWQGLYGRE
jgi:hypothetical protein